MYKKAFSHFIVVLCTTAFILPRIASLHALSHTEEKDNFLITCDLCDLITTTDFSTPFLNGPLTSDLEPCNNPNRKLFYGTYDIPLGKIATPRFIYNKPPPTVILG